MSTRRRRDPWACRFWMSRKSDHARRQGLLPEDMQERYKAVPVRLDGKRLTVAMANPKDVFALDEMRMKTGMDVQAVLIPPSQMEALQNGSLQRQRCAAKLALPSGEEDEDERDDEIADMLGMLAPVEKDPTKEEQSGPRGSQRRRTTTTADHRLRWAAKAMSRAGAQLADEAPIIRIVNTILMYAIKDGASDIHIEPQQKGVRIRYRIDGVLHEQMKVPQYVLEPAGFAHQDHGRYEHRRAPHSAGRTHPPQDAGKRLRHARQLLPDRLRRESRDAYSGQEFGHDRPG